ncbi:MULTISPECIES: AbgT family transporter [Corynebacterium]|uniref:AbgT family transporter n=1 Tax=Corynebacterium TaxID=1716 RepID=UPI001CEF9A9E|nr:MULTISPECIES: AbgT family transporter [Corynebacterium]
MSENLEKNENKTSQRQGESTATAVSDKPERGDSTSESTGVLGAIERIGNALPNPFWLFVILSGIVILSSWIGARIGMSATDPSSRETINVVNLMTAEYMQKMVTDAVENFVSFAPLGLILVCMLGVAVAEYSGFISAAIRSAIAKVRHPAMLTFAVALAGVTGSIASDAVYVILIPLGAASFNAVGRNPIVGAMVAFAASSAGFNSSLILNITDVLLAGISTQAAAFVDPEYVVSPLANYFFSMASAVVLSLLITAVTELFVTKHVQKTVDDSKINYDEASFNTPDHLEDEGSEDDLSVHSQEVRALKAAGWAAALFMAAWFALLFIPGSPMRGEGDGILNSPLLTDIVVSIALLFAVIGMVYGKVMGTITSSSDVPDFMEKGLDTLTAMLVLFFAVSQFTAYFQWSNIGQWTAIKGAEFLTSADLPPVVLFGALVLMVAVLNIFITSGSAQWALMAPVVVPMLMYVNISPEVAQMLFRVGDSPTNIITPMSPYFALALSFLQKYYKPAGVGTLMSLAIPYSLVMLVGWFLFFILWYALGIPLGPGVPVR